MTYLMITGSRNWDDELILRNALSEAYIRLFDAQDNVGPTLLVGGAVGADRMAENVWKMSHLTFIRESANWTAPCREGCSPHHRKGWRDGSTYCPQAGFYRNQRLISYGPALVLAFIRPCIKTGCPRKGKHDSHGTAQAVELAEAAHIPVWPYRAE